MIPPSYTRQLSDLKRACKKGRLVSITEFNELFVNSSVISSPVEIIETLTLS